MLDPQDRQLLLNALRPPEGFELTFAIGTTYTLDLLALLTAPLGFTLYELAGPPGAQLQPDDAVRLLSVLRRYADRITVFCESGRINVPGKHAILLGQLEGSIVPVRPPEGGSFHPKVWALRFHGDEGGVRYRLLCLTRNLTFDRSWDTVTTLDGTLVDRKLGFSPNRPLGDFFAALPAMAVRPDLPGDAAANVATAAEELRRVRFEVPAPFSEITFHPVGVPGYPRFHLLEAERTFAMAPFLSDPALREIAQASDEAMLVSRVDQLDLINPETLQLFDEVKVFDSGAAIQPSDVDEDSANALGTAGLHAKMFIQEVGRSTTVFTGSANATTAAFRKNVEFMVGLEGPTSKCGIDVLLAPPASGRVGLDSLLHAYTPSGDVPVVDVEREALEERLEAMQCAVAGVTWTAQIDGDDAPFTVTLSGHLHAGDEAVTVRVRPILLPRTASVRLPHEGGDVELVFASVSFESLTAFFAFELTLTGHPDVPAREFVVKAHLVGEPAGRRERIAQYLLRDREAVIRFLLSLLADGQGEDGGPFEIGPSGPEGKGSSRADPAGSDALLEPLLRALDRDPGRIDEVASILNDLGKTDEGKAKLPPGIELIWPSIWAVREALKAGGRG